MRSPLVCRWYKLIWWHLKKSIVNFNIHKHATLKIDVVSPPHLNLEACDIFTWNTFEGSVLVFQFDNVLSVTLHIYTSLTKENIRELSFPDSSDCCPSETLWRQNNVSNNFSQPRYLSQLQTGSNSLIFIFSECNTSLN